MPLIKQNLETGIIAALRKAAKLDQESDDPDKALREIAKDLSTSIDAYIRAATIITPAGAGSIQ